MPAGDGLLLRVRPHCSRLDPDQGTGLVRISESFGNGQLDLGSRATLQLRGVREGSLPEVHRRLQALDLLDPDPRVEARRNIMTTPFWREGDGTLELVRRLEEALLNAPICRPSLALLSTRGNARHCRMPWRISGSNAPGKICCCVPMEWPGANASSRRRPWHASSNC
ncbi:hypothetical protein ACFSYD_18140 [Paracoccus aerius]